MKKNTLTMALMLLTAAIWGYAFVAQIKGSDHLSPFTFNAARYILGAVSLLPVVLIFDRDTSDKKMLLDTLKGGIIAGAVLFGASYLQQAGAEMTMSSGVSGFITGLYNIFTPIAYLLVFKKKTAITVWIGAALSVVGLFMLCVGEDGLSIGKGEILLILGAVLWTAHILTVDLFAKRTYVLKFAFTQFFASALFSGVFALAFEWSEFSFSSIVGAGIPLLYCGVLSVGVAYTLQIVAQRYTDNPTKAAVILSTESVFSAIGGIQFGIDHISVPGYIGCALIFAAILLTQVPQREKKALPGDIK